MLDKATIMLHQGVAEATSTQAGIDTREALGA